MFVSAGGIGYGVSRMKTEALIRPSERRRLWGSLVLILLFLAAVNVPFAVTKIRSRTGARALNVVDARDADATGLGWVARTPHADPWPEPDYWLKHARFGHREYDIRRSSEEPGVNGYSMTVQHLGWPLPVIEIKQMWWDWNDPALAGPEPDPAPRLMASGLVGNPLIVGVPVWLVFVVLPLGVRLHERRKRAKRNDCVWCGYEAGGLAVCPECGRAGPGAG